MQLEDIEWTNYWVNTTKRDRKHVLIIGDSISCGYRTYLAPMLNDHYVLAIGTSHGIDNPMLMKEIEMYGKAENFDVDAVVFNNGLHAMPLSTDEYAENYKKTVAFIKNLFPKARLLIALSTTVTVKDAPEKFDTDNGKVIERNSAVAEIAKENSLEVIDLYSLVAPHPEYKNSSLHFFAEGYQAIARRVFEALEG